VIALIGVALPLMREGLTMYQVIWSREIEGEDFPVHEVVFEASSWQQCYERLVDNAKADIHTVGWYSIIEKEKTYET